MSQFLHALLSSSCRDCQVNSACICPQSAGFCGNSTKLGGVGTNTLGANTVLPLPETIQYNLTNIRIPKPCPHFLLFHKNWNNMQSKNKANKKQNPKAGLRMGECSIPALQKYMYAGERRTCSHVSVIKNLLKELNWWLICAVRGEMST